MRLLSKDIVEYFYLLDGLGGITLEKHKNNFN